MWSSLSRLDVCTTKSAIEASKSKSHAIIEHTTRASVQKGGVIFDYCRRRLKFSESGANRYTRVARLLRRFPEAYPLLESRQVSLVAMSMVASVMTRENKAEVLGRITGKSQADVEALVATYRTGSPVRDRVRPVGVVKAPQKNGGAPAAANGDLLAASAQTPPPIANCQRSFHHSGGRNLTTTDKPPTETRAEPHYKVEFGAGAEFMRKFQEVKALLSAKYPASLTFAKTFEVLMDEYIEHHSPVKRAERRARRAAKRKDAMERVQTKRPRKAKPGTSRSRHIPDAIRDAVFKRDEGRCTYLGANNVRCNSAHDVEIDHIVPYSRGGPHSLRNLRLLCSMHNRLEAEKVLGKAQIERYVRRE